jgi:hypothetical protein
MDQAPTNYIVTTQPPPPEQQQQINHMVVQQATNNPQQHTEIQRKQFIQKQLALLLHVQ